MSAYPDQRLTWTQNLKMDDDPDDVLCCCEYVNNKGEKSHLLAVCCDCEDVDESCDRWFRGQTIGETRRVAVKESILDRVRIPTFLGQGARRIDDLFDLTAIPPLLAIPLWLYLASTSICITLLSFIVVPLGAIQYYLRVLKHKRRTQFFMSLSLASIFAMYYVFSLYAVPLGNISAMEHALLTLNLLLFLVTFAIAKLDPGVVKIKQHPSTLSLNHYRILDDPPSQNSQKTMSTPYKRTNGSPSKESDTEVDTSRCKSIGTGTDDLFTDEGPESKDWCSHCQHVKPPRAGHCRICGQCVHQLDHHCVWIDCCVGRDNHRSFIVLLLLFISGGTWGAVRAAHILYSIVQYEYSIWAALAYIYSTKGHSIIFVSVLYSCIACPSVLALLLQQCHLITHNWTYRERKLSRRRPSGGEQLALLDQGFVTNWLNFVGNKRDLSSHAGRPSTRVV